MKNILYLIAAVAMLLCTSCEDFLDTNTYTDKTASDFPSTADEAQQALTAIYNNLNQVTANPQRSFFYLSELACDDQLGGGGFNDQLMQAVDLMMNSEISMYDQFYKDRYKGVYSANFAIETLPNCKNAVGEETLNQYLGEAYFLRAYYYYELASMFGNIPCTISTIADPTLPQVSGSALWGQILQDLKTAVEMMPATAQNGSGHVDKYCAEAMLARAYLFYSGFYGEASITCPDGTTIDKAYVTSAIDDCVANSGYDLVGANGSAVKGAGFYNLWPYTNKCTVNDELSAYKDKGLNWVGEGASNKEVMFSIKYNTQPSWEASEGTIGYTNQYALHFGIRGGQDFDKTFPFGQGWGAGPVAPNLVADWEAAEPNDPRRDASIQSVKELPGYTYGAAGWKDFAQETDYWQKKIVPVTARKSDGKNFWASFSNAYYEGLTWTSGNSDNFQLNNIQELVLIRFADVLLMQSELKGDATGMNRVRARAGLSPVAYSVEALRNERRWELAFEGIRWNDIRRYGEEYAKAALEKQNGVSIYTAGTPSKNNVTSINGGYSARYAATKGFVRIPENQISLSAQAGEQYKFVQNNGWGNDVEYSGWPK